MNKPHKHAEAIKAKADGSVIECRMIGIEVQWYEMDVDDFCFSSDFEYRIKSAPKWPETTMPSKELYSIYSNYSGTVADAFLAVANAALVHALKTGQVVLPELKNDQKHFAALVEERIEEIHSAGSENGNPR